MTNLGVIEAVEDVKRKYKNIKRSKKGNPAECEEAVRNYFETDFTRTMDHVSHMSTQFLPIWKIFFCPACQTISQVVKSGVCTQKLNSKNFEAILACTTSYFGSIRHVGVISRILGLSFCAFDVHLEKFFFFWWRVGGVCVVVEEEEVWVEGESCVTWRICLIDIRRKSHVFCVFGPKRSLQIIWHDVKAPKKCENDAAWYIVLCNILRFCGTFRIFCILVNFYRGVRSLLYFSLTTKCASKLRKYGPEKREITPKWRTNLGYDVEHAKIAQKFLDSKFWEQIPDFTTSLIFWPRNKKFSKFIVF